MPLSFVNCVFITVSQYYTVRDAFKYTECILNSVLCKSGLFSLDSPGLVAG